MRHNLSIANIIRVISSLLLAFLLLIYSPVASAKPIGACVQDPTGICTRDINPCGNPSVCGCSEGYTYNASIGKCLIDDIGLANDAGVEVKSRCALEPKGICTQDINQCGHASICQCPDNTTYSPVIGQCVKKLETPKGEY